MAPCAVASLRDGWLEAGLDRRLCFDVELHRECECGVRVAVVPADSSLATVGAMSREALKQMLVVRSTGDRTLVWLSQAVRLACRTAARVTQVCRRNELCRCS